MTSATRQPTRQQRVRYALAEQRSAARDGIFSAIERALGGERYILLITGDRGAGKTSLLERYVREAAAQLGLDPADVSLFATTPLQQLEPWGTLVHLLTHLGVPVERDAEAIYRRLLDALPTVVAIDDLDRFDQESLDLLSSALRNRGEQSGLAAIVTSSGRNVRGTFDEICRLEDFTEKEWIDAFRSLYPRPTSAAVSAMREAHSECEGDPSTLHRTLLELEQVSHELNDHTVSEAFKRASTDRALQLIEEIARDQVMRDLVIVLALLPDGAAKVGLLTSILGLSPARVAAIGEKVPQLVILFADVDVAGETVRLGPHLREHQALIARQDPAATARLRMKIAAALRTLAPVAAARQLAGLSYDELEQHRAELGAEVAPVILDAIRVARPEHAIELLQWAKDDPGSTASRFELILWLGLAQFGAGARALGIKTLRDAGAQTPGQMVKQKLAIAERLTLDERLVEAVQELRAALSQVEDQALERELACGLAAHFHDPEAIRVADEILRPGSVEVNRTPAECVACARLTLQPDEADAASAADYAIQALEAGYLGESREGGRTPPEVLAPVWILICAERYQQARSWLERAQEELAPYESYLPAVAALDALIATDDAQPADAELRLREFPLEKPSGPGYDADVFGWLLAAHIEIALLRGHFVGAHEAATENAAALGAAAPSSLRATAAAAAVRALTDAPSALLSLRAIAGRENELIWRPGIPYVPLLVRLERLSTAGDAATATLHRERARAFGAPRQLATATTALFDVRHMVGEKLDDHDALYQQARVALEAEGALDTRAGIELRLTYGPSADGRAAAQAAAEQGAHGLLAAKMVRSGRGAQHVRKLAPESYMAPSVLRAALWLTAKLPKQRWDEITGLKARTSGNYFHDAKSWLEGDFGSDPALGYLELVANVARNAATIDAIGRT